MQDQKQALVDKLKGANNILVTVSANPSVDQLAAAIGLTVFLNKLKKHATAVFSGEVPSTIDFLKPDDTLEKNTDSLRDFIISLDKSKADKLRYKVEENVVKIFITPYRTSLSQDDLNFSQGDFNVDVVLALGVHEQQDLDQAIIAHGRILHDATVMSVNVQPGPELGSVNWTMPDASSLSELALELVYGLSKDQVDSQIATAFLTGIVAETERFSNEKTSPETMRLSAELLTAGANQQLVSTELQKTQEPTPANDAPAVTDQPAPPKTDDGTLEIAHSGGDQPESSEPEQPSEPDTGSDEVPETVHDVKQNYFDGGPVLPPSQQQPHYLAEPPVMNGMVAPDEHNGPDEDIDVVTHDGMPEVPLLRRDGQKQDAPAEEAAPAVPESTDEPAMELPAPETDLPPVSDTQSFDGAPSTEVDTVPSASADTTAAPEPTDSTPPPEPPQPSDGPQTGPSDNFPPLESGKPFPPQPEPADAASNDGTLADLEKAVHSPHLQPDQPDSGDAAPDSDGSSSNPSDLDAALKAVQDVYDSTPVTADSLPPKQDVGASGYLKVQDLPGLSDASTEPPAETAASEPASGPVAAPGLTLPPAPGADFVPLGSEPPEATQPPTPPPMVAEPIPGNTPADTPMTMPLPPSINLPPSNPTPPTTPATGPSAPPPVPPPLPPMPPYMQPPQ